MLQLERLRARIEALFPERHLYVRQGGEMRAFVLSQRMQMIAAGGVAAAATWMGVCTAALLIMTLEGHAAPGRVQLAHAAPAPAASAQAAATEAAPSPAVLAANIERRHAALALLLADVRGAPGAAQALTPPIAQALATAADIADPVSRLKTVEAGQAQVLAAADAFALARAQRLRGALKTAGVAPSKPKAEGGPLILLSDSRAIAALQVDPSFAAQVQATAADLSEAKALSEKAGRLPLARPTRVAEETSGFGARRDPFTGQAAFHPGLDFAGARMTPVLATAPGVVSFTGVRTGYGNTVEVDHGGGYKTRYAHLAKINVRPGQRVAAGAQLGGMGSTGRSTGTHLHYEVWVNGRAQNPERFVRAGVQAAG